MTPRILLDSAEIPGGGVLKLFRRGTEFSIMLGGSELMNSRKSASEEALATLAIDRIPNRAGRSVLIGGLGMGFTLRAALAALGRDARVTVAELVPAVVAWARGPLETLFAGCLDDPRVAVFEGDVALCIGSGKAGYDAILLDVDNGPDGLSRAGNDALYGAAGLAAARVALKPGGVLAIWSAAPDPRFTARLDRAGFVVDAVRARAHAGAGPHHLIWLAT